MGTFSSSSSHWNDFFEGNIQIFPVFSAIYLFIINETNFDPCWPHTRSLNYLSSWSISFPFLMFLAILNQEIRYYPIIFSTTTYQNV